MKGPGCDRLDAIRLLATACEEAPESHLYSRPCSSPHHARTIAGQGDTCMSLCDGSGATNAVARLQRVTPLAQRHRLLNDLSTGQRLLCPHRPKRVPVKAPGQFQ
jgi:hypothetical protein